MRKDIIDYHSDHEKLCLEINFFEWISYNKSVTVINGFANLNVKLDIGMF